jgi:integrase
VAWTIWRARGDCRGAPSCRTVRRAALADAVEEGQLRRSPAARVPMAQAVAKPPKRKEVEAWTDEQVARFLAVSADHRWAVAVRLGVLYGLRRSEALAVKWNDLNTAKGTLRIDEGLVAVRTGAAWSQAKNARSRRVIPLDNGTLRALARHRKDQAEERLVAGPKWEDHDLIIATHAGRPVMPRSLDRALEILIEHAGLPRLTSHGLRHTAATHMVRGARDVGELRAVTDVLGHSPDMLMKVYAHAMPGARRPARPPRLRRPDPVAGLPGVHRATLPGRIRR